MSNAVQDLMKADLVIACRNTVKVYAYATEESKDKMLLKAKEYYRECTERAKERASVKTREDYKYWAKEYWEYKRISMEIMTEEEYYKIQKEYLFKTHPLKEITKKQWYDMLECLPPMDWHRGDYMQFFFMCEMYTGSYTNEYYWDMNNNKFYEKMVDYRDKSTWIKLEDIKTLRGNKVDAQS